MGASFILMEKTQASQIPQWGDSWQRINFKFFSGCVQSTIFFFLPICSVPLMLSFLMAREGRFQVFLCNGNYTFPPYTTKFHVTCGLICRTSLCVVVVPYKRTKHTHKAPVPCSPLSLCSFYKGLFLCFWYNTTVFQFSKRKIVCLL